ncbi:Nn.00g078050.m01.CDS01 [Neocucurbitaria sp. VM-36]
MFQSRNFYISLVGVLAWSSTAAETVLSILETASFSATQVPLVHVAAAASAFDVVSLCCIGFYTIQHAQGGRFLERLAQAKTILKSLSILLSAIALVVSLVLIILIKARWDQVTAISSKALVSNWSGLVAGQIALWAVSCVGQIVLYSTPFWHRKAPKVLAVTVSGPRDSVMSEMRSSPPRNLYLMESTQPTSPLAAALPSPTFSSRSSHSLQSFRESLRHVVHPVTSRTTLISRPSFNRDSRSLYSDSQSADNVSHSDGFDSWDTRDAIVQTAPSKGTTLDPIPGSRPNSPARALDGPFLSELPEEDDEELAPPPKLMPDTSRPPSPVVSEAHIHPLFRTESPTPPPATPGTSIIASPLANQAIACPARPFNRMRSNSHQTMSPSPLVSSGSFVHDRPRSPRSLSRSPTPPSREMTPPIPDFVLNSSPRSSMSGSRRVNLQYSPDR